MHKHQARKRKQPKHHSYTITYARHSSTQHECPRQDNMVKDANTRTKKHHGRTAKCGNTLKMVLGSTNGAPQSPHPGLVRTPQAPLKSILGNLGAARNIYDFCLGDIFWHKMKNIAPN